MTKIVSSSHPSATPKVPPDTEQRTDDAGGTRPIGWTAQPDATGTRSTVASERFEKHLTAHPRHLSFVRRAIKDRLCAWGRPGLAGPAALCVTELLSNVSKHARSPECVLTLRNLRDGVKGAVSDTSTSVPTVCVPDWFTESGRGMFLISTTADRWGVTPEPNGKTVWFTLRAEQALCPPTGPSLPAGRRPDGVDGGDRD